MSEIQHNKIDKIIKQLENVKMRPPMYMVEGIAPIYNFLLGFVSACDAFDIQLYQYEGIWRKVEEERGWKPASPMWDQLREAGLNDGEVTQEMLTLYIEVMRRLGNTLSQEV